MTALRALIVAAVLLVIWQAVVLVFQPPPYLLPGPGRVFVALGERPDLWKVQAVTTATETIIGFVTGSCSASGWRSP